jgi:hypothetical protein
MLPLYIYSRNFIASVHNGFHELLVSSLLSYACPELLIINKHSFQEEINKM